MKKLKKVIFDYDGVIGDTAPQHLQFFQDMMKEFGTDGSVVLRDFRQAVTLFTHSLLAFFIDLGFDPQVARKVHDIYEKEFHTRYTFNFFPGIDRLLADLSREGILLSIASANNGNNVRAGLNGNHDYFTHVLSGDQFDWDKVAMMDFILQDGGFSKEEVVFVGDMVSDMKVAEKTGIPFIAVTYGWQDFTDITDVNKVGSVAELREQLFNLI